MCPPESDQTTRFSQRWHITAPELLRFCDINSDSEARRSDDLRTKFFNSKSQWDAWGRLARPVISSPTIIPLKYSARVQNNSAKLSPLEKLSNELLDMIIEHLAPKKEDIIALGLSSQLLWQAVLHHIHAGYLKSAAPWAGKKIAFQGSYSMDLADAFNEDGLVESITGKSWFGRMCAARRFFWGHVDESLATPFDEEAGWLEAARSHQENSEIPEIYWSTIEEKLGCSCLFPKDREWLLRNLTTQETVSLGVLSGVKARKTQSENSNAVSFSDVLLMQTCWTSILSHVEEYKLNVHRGAWAGHRFDIVALETHQAEKKLNEWSDVSVCILHKAERLRDLLCSREEDSSYTVDQYKSSRFYRKLRLFMSRGFNPPYNSKNGSTTTSPTSNKWQLSHWERVISLFKRENSWEV